MIARALHDMGYDGPVGMQAFAKGKPEHALAAFRAAFRCDGLNALSA